MADKMHSTGRGGAGNIGQDPETVYTDGGIVREGPYGEPGKPGTEYSTGRGGVGNVKPDTSGTGQVRRDDELVPETNLREGGGDYADYHTGRGGQGNVHKDKFGGHSTKKEQDQADGKKSGGIGEKVKEALHMK